MASRSPTIEVYIHRQGLDAEKRLVIRIAREKLVQHSVQFASFLRLWPVANEHRREIILPEGSPSALQHVLNIIKSHNGRQAMYVTLKDLSIPQKLAVWNACHLLGLRPRKALRAVGNHLGWVISHAKMTPEIMKATYDCTVMYKDSPDREKSKIWHSMIHQYVWDLIHGKFLAGEEEALVDAYMPHPEFSMSIDEKFDELKAKNVQFRQNRIENIRRRAVRRVARCYERREKAQQKKIEEVATGLRPMTEDVKDAVLARQRVPSDKGKGKGKEKVLEQ